MSIYNIMPFSILSRTVSKAKGQGLATDYECSFYETAAAEDFDSVENVFHSLIRDIGRINERVMTLQPLFISEEKAAFLNPGTQVWQPCFLFIFIIIWLSVFILCKSPSCYIDLHDVKWIIDAGLWVCACARVSIF